MLNSEYKRKDNSMKNAILNWSKRRYSKGQRLIALIPACLFFLIGIPFALVILSPFIDAYLRLPKFVLEPLNIIIALFLIIPSLSFSAWSVWVQFKIGEGTPIPMMPTQKLVVDGPYAYCRNPMTLGMIIFYFGISVWIGSLSSIGLTMLFTVLIIAYVKLVEEKELEARFGEEYIKYKKRTPFLIPKRRKK